MELQLYNLFTEKRSIGRRVGRRWLERHAKIIYGNIYPNQVVQKEGEPTAYKGFRFSNRWFRGFKERYDIALQVSIIITYIYLTAANSLGSYKEGTNRS